MSTIQGAFRPSPYELSVPPQDFQAAVSSHFPQSTFLCERKGTMSGHPQISPCAAQGAAVCTGAMDEYTYTRGETLVPVPSSFGQTVLAACQYMPQCGQTFE